MANLLQGRNFGPNVIYYYITFVEVKRVLTCSDTGSRASNVYSIRFDVIFDVLWHFFRD